MSESPSFTSSTGFFRCLYTAAENMPKAAAPRMISPCGPIIEPSTPERPAPEEDAAFIASASPFIALAAFGTVFAAAVAFLIDEDKAVIPDETLCAMDIAFTAAAADNDIGISTSRLSASKSTPFVSTGNATSATSPTASPKADINLVALVTAFFRPPDSKDLCTLEMAFLTGMLILLGNKSARAFPRVAAISTAAE